ncbi:hypothetical protein ACP70R_022885 [Stipagrostis hirtigluma subsp. patula]
MAAQLAQARTPASMAAQLSPLRMSAMASSYHVVPLGVSLRGYYTNKPPEGLTNYGETKEPLPPLTQNEVLLLQQIEDVRSECKQDIYKLQKDQIKVRDEFNAVKAEKRCCFRQQMSSKIDTVTTNGNLMNAVGFCPAPAAGEGPEAEGWGRHGAAPTWSRLESSGLSCSSCQNTAMSINLSSRREYQMPSLAVSLMDEKAGDFVLSFLSLLLLDKYLHPRYIYVAATDPFSYHAIKLELGSYTHVAMKLAPNRKKFMEIISGSGDIKVDIEKFCATFSPLLAENQKFL